MATVNTAMLQQSGITSETEVEGVVKNADGTPKEELQAIALAASGVNQLLAAVSSEATIWNYGAFARNAGITAVTDLAGLALSDRAALAT